jgi:hypothetical protein
MPENDPPKTWIELVWRVLVAAKTHLFWAAGVLFTGIVTWLATRSGVPIPIPPQPPIVQTDDVIGAQGWVPHPEAVAAIANAIPIKSFGATPAGAVDEATLPADVFLWEAHRKVTGSLPPAKNQGGVGSCVSFGTNTAVERTSATSIVAGANAEFKFICEEVTYGGSRVEIGRGQIRGDGSVGAWAAKFIHDWGVVSREPHGAVDLSRYSEARCRDYGSKGVPAAIEALAREHPVQTYTQVGTWGDAKKALASGYGIAVCSDVGFTMARDSRGVCRAQGSWGHCMCLDGYHVDSSGEYGHIENSWGPNAHTGPVGWGSPSTAGFWADSKTITRMLSQGDSWTFSNVKGFPEKRIDWFALRRNDVRPLFALVP